MTQITILLRISLKILMVLRAEVKPRLQLIISLVLILG
jgi:hypothetical protein